MTKIPNNNPNTSMFKAVELQPEQKKVLKLDPKNIVLIKGVAGSGKTTIALYRAKHLLDNYANLFDPSRVIIFTYNKLLSNYLIQLKAKVKGGYGIDGNKASSTPTTGLNVEVSTFHKWAYHFINKHHPTTDYYRIATSKEIISAFNIILIKNHRWSISGKSLYFLMDEIKWIKGKYIQTREEYLDISRTGRGTSEKLSKEQRDDVWNLYIAYNSYLQSINAIDFDDYALKVLDIIDRMPNFKPPFSHIVVDEAQDLTKAQLLVIKRLVSTDTNSITIIADTAQRIYKSGFVWSEIGFEFKGRTCVLKKNYRSTIEIARAALSLLNNDATRDEFTQIESARRGTHLPVIARFETKDKQWEYIEQNLPSLLAQYGNVVFLHHHRDGVEQIAAKLSAFGHCVNILSKDNKVISNNNLHVCTLSSIKGLEFDVVFILDCNKGSYPNEQWIAALDDELHTSTERRLLYTAMTRARERLYICSSSTPSMFLDEIDSDLVENI